MDPGTALAVVPLVIQLIGTIRSINVFLRTIHDAPSEVIALVETLDQTQSSLNQVRCLIEKQSSDARMATSPVFIFNALKTCERRIKALEVLISEVKASWSSQHLVKRTWANLNVRTKMTRIQQLHSQLRDAITNLHFAISNNVVELQLHQMQMAASYHTLLTNQLRALTATGSDSLSIVPQTKVELALSGQDQALASAGARPAFSMVTQQANTVWYQGFLGVLETRKKLMSVGSSQPRSRKKSVLIEKIVAIRTWLLKREVEICFGASFASIPRALRIYYLVAWDNEVFAMCEAGNLEGLRELFADGSVSPFIIDPFGRTLLYAAAELSRAETCSFLIRLGLDANRAESPHLGKPMTASTQNLGWLTASETIKRAIDTLRVLVQAQGDISSTDVSYFFQEYYSPPDIANFFLSLDAVRYEMLYDASEEGSFPALGAALRQYSTDRRDFEWESIMRKLLRNGVDVHAPIPRSSDFDPDDYPCVLSPYGTPLDELFMYAETASDADTAADAWLQILASEGYDILAYLQTEKALHATQPPLTFPYYSFADQTPRQLVFNLGENPSVWADWWIDPENSAYLVRQEFKDMACPWNPTFEWYGDWPFIYPRWRMLWYTDEEKILHKLAQRRADRRWHKKARKAARRNRTRDYHSMPGAWPGQ